jgi:7-carboxy-7-deazaguanine synthase
MRPPPTLKTIDAFASIQGEGLRQGQPTIFVRLGGCNLRCPFCDTKYARRGGDELEVSLILGLVELVREAYPARWVCLTGGEPLLQDIRPLVRGLKAEGLKVQVETNGTFAPRPAADWYTVSPKPPAYRFHPLFAKKAREVKLVVSRDLAYGTVRSLRRAFPAAVPLLLQPQSNARWSARKAADLLHRAVQDGLGDIRISIQLHKVLGLP